VPPNLTLDFFQQARQLDWDLRDEQNRPVQDPAVREAMIRAESDGAYAEVFQADQPTTIPTLERLASTTGRSDWSGPSAGLARRPPAVLASQPFKLLRPYRSSSTAPGASTSGPPQRGGPVYSSAALRPLVLLC
jgi:hypothetical protein